MEKDFESYAYTYPTIYIYIYIHMGVDLGRVQCHPKHTSIPESKEPVGNLNGSKTF